MKKVFQIVLGIVILVLIYVFYQQLMEPIKFQKEVDKRRSAVISRIMDIRTAEQAYKQKYQKYTGSFDTLINFILNDTLTYERTIGDRFDSVAVARGLVKTELFNVAAVDTLFRGRLTPAEIRELPIIPYSNGQRYLLAATQFTTESTVVVPVFECKAPYKVFLSDLDEQEVINLIDNAKTIGRYPGIKVGALDQATNDAGNWE